MSYLMQMKQKIDEGAYLAKTELCIDPMGAALDFTVDEMRNWRNSLRQLIDEMALNNHEIAVVMSAPFAPLLRETEEGRHSEYRVRRWVKTELIRADIADYFLKELRVGEFDDCIEPNQELVEFSPKNTFQEESKMPSEFEEIKKRAEERASSTVRKGAALASGTVKGATSFMPKWLKIVLAIIAVWVILAILVNLGNDSNY